MIRDLPWRIHRYFTDNWKYIEKYRRTRHLDDLSDYIRKSRSIDVDIDEVVQWCRCYNYYVDGKHYHAHSFKELLLDLIELMRYVDRQPEIEFEKEDYHPDELKILERFMDVLKGEREVL